MLVAVYCEPFHLLIKRCICAFVLSIASLHMAVRATYSRNLLLTFMTYFQLEVSFQGLKGCDTSKASQLNGVTNHNTDEKLLVMRD